MRNGKEVQSCVNPLHRRSCSSSSALMLSELLSTSTIVFIGHFAGGGIPNVLDATPPTAGTLGNTPVTRHIPYKDFFSTVMTSPGPAFQECTGSCKDRVSRHLGTLSTILQHFTHRMKPSDPLLLDFSL